MTFLGTVLVPVSEAGKPKIRRTRSTQKSVCRCSRLPLLTSHKPMSSTRIKMNNNNNNNSKTDLFCSLDTLRNDLEKMQKIAKGVGSELLWTIAKLITIFGGLVILYKPSYVGSILFFDWNTFDGIQTWGRCHQQILATPCRNKALWLVKRSHMTFEQPIRELYSPQHSYMTIKFGYDIGSRGSAFHRLLGYSVTYFRRYSSLVY